MQGRITKVLNMKAVEILAMIEEAAGTRMFEDRKDKALKTMAKKDMKLQEITGLLKDEIEPKLEKLRSEKRAFLDFQQTQSDLQRLTRLVVAHDYVRNQEKLKHFATELDQKKDRCRALEESATKLKSEVHHLEGDMKHVTAQREKELRKGGKFQALEEEVKTHSHEAVRLATVLELKESSINEESAKRATVESSVAELEGQLKDKSKIYDRLQASYDAAKTKLDKETADVERQEELLQTLQTGVASREGQEQGYQGQLQGTKGSRGWALIN